MKAQGWKVNDFIDLLIKTNKPSVSHLKSLTQTLSNLNTQVAQQKRKTTKMLEEYYAECAKLRKLQEERDKVLLQQGNEYLNVLKQIAEE